MVERQKLKLLLLPIFLLIFSLSVLAGSDYNETGNIDGTFTTGTGFFNTEITGVTSSTRAISDSRQTPLVSDLDGDGIQEIIVLDAPNIRLYQNRTLDILDAFNLYASERYSNMITYDIDGDSLQEIILVLEQSNRLEIIEYNGTSFYLQNTLNISNLNHIDGETMVKCGAVNQCLLVYIDDISDVDTNNVYATGFNSTALGGNHLLETDVNNGFCFSKVRNIQYVDYDNDATTEYIFTFQRIANLFTDWVNINSTLGVTSEGRQTTSMLSEGGADNCVTDNTGQQFTSPLTFDIDGSPSNGLETIIGYQTATNEFRMRSFDSNRNDLDTYPNTFLADGNLVSNVFKANVFPDTGNVDFCVFGYIQDSNDLDMLCGSAQKGGLNDNDEFMFDNEDYYNISFGYNDPWIPITHSGQMSTETTDGNNLNEIINSYGIFKVDYNGDIQENFLELIYENTATDGVVIPVDYEKVGREDLLVLTSTNIWYIDDGFVNTAPNISEYYVNPCLDSTWQLNSTVEVRITSIDAESETVQNRAILYEGEGSLEQDSGWTANVSSGTTSSFSFSANSTTGLSTLRLMTRDTKNINDPNSIDLSYSIAVDGVAFGDCSTTQDLITAAENDELNLTTLDKQDNAVLNFVNTTGEGTGLGGTLIFLLLMMGVAIWLWINGNKNGAEPKDTMGLIMLVEVLAVLVGIYVGIINWVLILVLIVFAILILSMVFRQKFTGG